jgi:translation initiation factor IF-3
MKQNTSKKPANRLNKDIIFTVPKTFNLRIVGDSEIESSKTFNFNDILLIAEARGVDIVEISNSNNVSVCKLVDYKKFQYDQKKKEKELAQKQKENNKEQKEVRFTSNTDENDVLTKKKHIEGFINKGHKVKLVVQFKGRNIVYKERGEIILLTVANDLLDICKIEQMPQMNGRNMSMILTPKK